MNDLTAAALTLAHHGVSVVPVRTDGTKRPALTTWADHQNHQATPETIRAWFDGPTPAHGAVGLITGAVSGNLEMAEIEGRAAHEMGNLQSLAEASGLGPLWAKLCNGWLEQSPSGGYHWFYRLHETPGRNTKLAGRPSTAEELEDWKRIEQGNADATPDPELKAKRLAKIAKATIHTARQVLAETRGEGGFVVTAPSTGATHETGRPWRIVAGGPATVPTITGEELEQFHFLLSSLNVEPPAPAPAPARTAPNMGAGALGSVSPLDDYEARTDWAEILAPAGWRHAFTSGNVRYWTRPGKTHGISATTGKDSERDRLFVFTSSTEFEAETPYTKQGAYALLHHDGNHSAAASALRKSGYGKDATIPTGGTPSAPQPGASPFAITARTPTPGPAQDNTSAWQPATGQPTSLSSTPDQPTTATTGPAAAGNDGWATEGNLATVTDITPRIVDGGHTIAHTDDGNANLLIHNHGHELRYNPDRGRWLYWTGNVWEWQPDTHGMARELAKHTVRGIVPGHDAEARAWKKKSLSSGAIGAMLTQAATDPRMVVFLDQLDANAWELNTPGGIIDLRTATLLPADPKSLHTKLTSVTPDFDGTSPDWESFLETTFPDARDLRDYVQRLLGYSAVGIVREHILPMALGEGGNGKGVTFETTVELLGDYAVVSPPNFLMKQTFQGHSTDLAMLQGARFVLNDEVSPKAQFDEAKVKMLAGGNSITARFMRKDNFTFKPTHQIWLSLNDQPGVESGGEGFWRRVRAVPFTHTVPDAEKDPGLKDRLVGESGAVILAWIARGAADYYQGGLREPEQVKAATAEYARNVDTVGKFLEAECSLGNPFEYTNCNALRNAYERFCQAEGDTPAKGKQFTNQLEKHGVTSGPTIKKGPNGQRQYGMVALLSATFWPGDQQDQPEQTAGF